MAPIKLTIAIGTYNRPEYIQRQVRDLLPQISGKGVRLVVYDNCSNIPVVSLFSREELSLFEVYRNKVNIGRDQNQVRCFEIVDEGWVWTLSDDDLIKSDSVSIILELISNHNNCCFINLSNKKEQLVYSFDELVDYFKITGSFGISFFQSECIYNVEVIGKSLCWFNDFLSSQIGQICMVLKHMELNPGSTCYFTKERLTCDVRPGGWNALDFITNSSIIIDKFHYKRKLLKNNLFKGIGDMYFTLLASQQLGFRNFWYYHSYVIFKLGFINVIRYNFITFSGSLIRRVVPTKLFLAIKSIISHNYNAKAV